MAGNDISNGPLRVVGNDEPDRPRILIADDDPDILALVRFRLGHAGYEVAAARDGIEAM